MDRREVIQAVLKGLAKKRKLSKVIEGAGVTRAQIYSMNARCTMDDDDLDKVESWLAAHGYLGEGVQQPAQPPVPPAAQADSATLQAFGPKYLPKHPPTATQSAPRPAQSVPAAVYAQTATAIETIPDAEKLLDLTGPELHQVKLHRYFLSQTRGQDVPFDDAARDWLQNNRTAWLQERQRRMLAMQRDEIAKYKWIRSEQLGRDVEATAAALEWISKYAGAWREWFEKEYQEEAPKAPEAPGAA
jgi:hypothetical protein